jgi:hypothetical protein
MRGIGIQIGKANPTHQKHLAEGDRSEGKERRNTERNPCGKERRLPHCQEVFGPLRAEQRLKNANQRSHQFSQ